MFRELEAEFFVAQRAHQTQALELAKSEIANCNNPDRDEYHDWLLRHAEVQLMESEYDIIFNLRDDDPRFNFTY